MPSTHHTVLKWLAAAVWYGGAAVLLWKGASWLLTATAEGGRLWPVCLGGAALAVGLLRGRTAFRRAAVRNLQRIRRLDSPRPWHVFRPVFFLALGAMFAAAILLGSVARSGYWGMVVVGSLDLVIGSSLLTGATAFWTWRPDSAGVAVNRGG